MALAVILTIRHLLEIWVKPNYVPQLWDLIHSKVMNLINTHYKQEEEFKCFPHSYSSSVHVWDYSRVKEFKGVLAGLVRYLVRSNRILIVRLVTPVWARLLVNSFEFSSQFAPLFKRHVDPFPHCTFKVRSKTNFQDCCSLSEWPQNLSK